MLYLGAQVVGGAGLGGVHQPPVESSDLPPVPRGGPFLFYYGVGASVLVGRPFSRGHFAFASGLHGGGGLHLDLRRASRRGEARPSAFATRPKLVLIFSLPPTLVVFYKLNQIINVKVSFRQLWGISRIEQSNVHSYVCTTSILKLNKG